MHRSSIARSATARSAAALGLLALALAATTGATAASAAPAAPPAPAYAPGDVVTIDGVAVTAPAPGQGVTLVVDRVDGSHTTLVVETAADGTVTVGEGADAAVAAPTSDAAPDKCNDSAFSVINGASWKKTYAWHFRASTTPNELTKSSATKALKQSVNNITKSANKCGLPDQVSAKNAYKGTTSQQSDVTAQPACKASPGAQNVTEFGPMPGGILAATCTYTTGSGGTITDADVRINTNFSWWTGGGGCSGDYSIQAVQTHEYGHAFGLGHVEEGAHGNLTMSTNINAPCSAFEASLGRGDVLALRSLY